MATLHIFNPEHDIALASDLANFTAPHAGRQLRADLGFLPALWAKEDDAIYVDHVEYAQKAFRRVMRKPVQRTFVASPTKVDDISPWGWDKALRAELKRKGCDASLLPTDDQLVASPYGCPPVTPVADRLYRRRSL